jgi:hypothetical protein
VRLNVAHFILQLSVTFSRLNEGKVTATCSTCGSITGFPCNRLNSITCLLVVARELFIQQNTSRAGRMGLLLQSVRYCANPGEDKGNCSASNVRSNFRASGGKFHWIPTVKLLANVVSISVHSRMIGCCSIKNQNTSSFDKIWEEVSIFVGWNYLQPAELFLDRSSRWRSNLRP